MPVLFVGDEEKFPDTEAGTEAKKQYLDDERVRIYGAW
jgi:hypothetical protein